MIRAYDKVYLENARRNLARMLDFAVYDLKYDISVFFDMFIKSGIASRFESGDFNILAGKSGVEIAYEVVDHFGQNIRNIKPKYATDRSEEYWLGWALAYYQWETGLSFADIIKYIPIKDILALYMPYHEMDIHHFCDRMNKMYLTAKPDTNLQILRKKAGLSQKQLAEFSGVPLRTIQQYEQRQKNINKAQSEYLIMLSKALYCKSEDLIEYVVENDIV